MKHAQSPECSYQGGELENRDQKSVYRAERDPDRTGNKEGKSETVDIRCRKHVYSDVLAGNRDSCKGTSIPPESSAINTPIASIAIPALLFNRSNIFSSVRKVGLILVIIIEKTMRTRKI